MVKKDIENIIDQNKVINQNNIIDLADYFLNKMNLKKYVKNINFDNSYCSFYDNETFEINLNYNHMIEYAISNYSDSYCINYEMIFYLLHEISHSLQTKIIYESKQKLLASIYEDSYDRIKYFYDLYQTYHDDFLIEYNADLNGLIEASNFMRKLKNYAGDDYELINYILKNGYQKNNKLIISPVQKESIIVDEQFNYKEIINNKDYKKMNNYQKVLHGLPIEENTFNKFDDIKEVMVLKKVLK